MSAPIIYYCLTCHKPFTPKDEFVTTCVPCLVVKEYGIESVDAIVLFYERGADEYCDPDATRFFRDLTEKASKKPHRIGSC